MLKYLPKMATQYTGRMDNATTFTAQKPFVVVGLQSPADIKTFDTEQEAKAFVTNAKKGINSRRLSDCTVFRKAGGFDSESARFRDRPFGVLIAGPANCLRMGFQKRTRRTQVIVRSPVPRTAVRGFFFFAFRVSFSVQSDVA